MTIFTKVVLNPARREGRKLLTNTHAMHAVVRKMFPPDISEDRARVLWRLDSHEHTHVLYVVGPEKPTIVESIEKAGWDTRPPQSADYQRLLNSLTRGQRWRFELVANPTHAEFIKGKRGKVKAHVSPRHQLDWLYKKASTHGFALAPRPEDKATDDERSRWSPLEVTSVTQSWTDSFNRRNATGSRGKPVRIVKARFAGTLEVTDAETLRNALTHGIGRSRGYGCGLLTLAPVR